MNLTAAALKVLIDKGLSLADVAAFVEANEKKTDNTNAQRQARFRENKRRNARYSNDVIPNDNTLTPEGSEAKASSQTKWVCPEGVNPGHWADFLANRRRKRCAQSQTALDGVLNDLATISDDEWPPGRLVQHAAAKGWASINDPRKPKYERPEQRSGIGKSAAAFAALNPRPDEPF